MIQDYSTAEINAERALYLSDNDEEVLECSLKLATIYFAQEDFDGTIDSIRNAIKYYIKIHSITDVELMKGNVQDEFLADNHMQLAILLSEQMRESESNNHLKKAALSGSKHAIDTFEKNGMEYK